MGNEDRSLDWRLRFGTESGGLIEAKAGLEEVGAAGTAAGEQVAAGMEGAAGATQEATAAQEAFGVAAEESGGLAEKAMTKVEHHLERMVISLFLMQLALRGFEEVVKTNENFQELQQTFKNWFESMVDSGGPALSMMAKALSGLLTISASIGPVVKANFELVIAVLKASFDSASGIIKVALDIATGHWRNAWEDAKKYSHEAVKDFHGVGDQYKAGWKSVVAGVQEGYAVWMNTSKIFTKEMEAELAQRVKDEVSHNNDLLKIEMAHYQEKLRNKYLSRDQIKAIYDEEGAAQIATLQKNNALEMQVLHAKLTAHMLTLAQFHNQKYVLEQQAASKELLLTSETASKKKILDDAAMDAELANIQSITRAAASAFAQKMQQTNDMAQASRAAASASINMLAQEAAKEIEINGLRAAATAFAQAPNIYLGAVEAAGVLAWYSALAAGVGAVGSALSNSISPAASSSSASSAPTTAATASSTAPAGSTAAAQGSAAPAQAAGSGGGQPMTLSIAVLLDGTIIGKTISQLSYNGGIAISAKCLVN